MNELPVLTERIRNREKAKGTQMSLVQETVRTSKPVSEAEGWDLGKKSLSLFSGTLR